MLARRNFFNDFMSDPFDFGFFGTEPAPKANASLMKTDVKETDDGYQVAVDLPGFKKDEIKIKLENGTLTINAAKGLDKDEKNKEGKYVRRERYAGSMSRSFYVGEHVTAEQVHPKYENGILTFEIPKNKEPVEEKEKFIAIEG